MKWGKRSVFKIEELPEGVFLATSDELPGLVAQGRTAAEAFEIARNVARKLIEARRSVTVFRNCRPPADSETTRSSWLRKWDVLRDCGIEKLLAS